MGQAIRLSEYLQTLTEASNAVWRVFKTARLTGQDPSKVFEQILQKYADTSAKSYVSAYIALCREELFNAPQDVNGYLTDANKATAEMWKIFKAFAEKINADTMTDDDWSKLADSASELGCKRYDYPTKGYVFGYTVLCVHELDRWYREKHGISEEMTLSEYMKEGVRD